MNLEPIEPQEALDLYLADRENSVAEATIYSHRSRLGHFVRWCIEQGMTNLNELTGRILHEYRIWRRNEGDLSKVTEKTQMDTLRVFVKWLESVDGVEPNLHEKVLSPTLTGDDNIRDVMLDSDRADEVLAHLRKYEYASRPHAVLGLMYHTMMRVGAVHALDLADYDSKEQSLEVVHRPDTGTPIKNQKQGERFVGLSGEICTLLDDWIADQRPKSTDEHGREPLITTAQGRAHVSTLRNDCYRYTRSCVVEGECPHGRTPEECPAMDYESASECPSSVSPHALRRGGITLALSNNWPTKELGDRASVSERVLSMHYDQRSAKEKMEQRRQYLDNI